MDSIHDLINSIDQSLPIIQNNFDKYQVEFFKKRPPEFFCLELNGEAGELANLEKKLWKGRDIPDESCAEESADVFIALMNYCNSKGINLASALSKKLNEIDKIRISRYKQGLEY